MSSPRLLVLAGLSWLIVVASCAAWADCPLSCRCRWTSGKKSALCPGAGLSQLPGSLDPDTQVLELSGNRIPELASRAFKRANLLNLQRVFARGAGIERIHRDAFEDMGILVELDLSDNHLRELDEGTFLHNERLKLLVLSGNPLGVLRDNQFPNLPHLKTLELQRCGLREIHRLAFHRLVALETLSLEKNELEYLESDTINQLRRLKTLGLDQNPWSCDCRMREFSRLMTSGNRLYAVPQSCTNPPWLSGRRWEDVRTTEFACKPKIYLPVTSVQQQLDVNGNLSLSCLATGDPEPEVWWSSINGATLNNATREPGDFGIGYAGFNSAPAGSGGSTGGIVVYSTSLETRRHLVERWSNLTIYNASEVDGGKYTCNARNTAGTASKTVEVSVPQVGLSSPTLSHGVNNPNGGSDNWLLWLSLAGGSSLALCASALVGLVALCVCHHGSRANSKRGGKGAGKGGKRHHHHRSKVKLQGSASFGDQEKKLLDLSVTTTATTTSTTTACSSNSSSSEHQPPSLHQQLSNEESNYEVLPPHHHHHHSNSNSNSGMPMLISQQQQQQAHNGYHHNGYHNQGGANDFELDFDSCSVQEYVAAAAVVQANIYPVQQPAPANPVFIAVSLPQHQESASIQVEQPSSKTYERCYPDLLDIGFSSGGYASTLPRRSSTQVKGAELGSPYDNMGPRVTATGSSTFSLVEDPKVGELLCEPPHLAKGSLGGIGIVTPMPLIQPPPEFVSL